MMRTMIWGLLLILLAACGPAGVKGEAPFVQVTNWSIDNRDLMANLRIRNVNSETLEIQSLRMSVNFDGEMLFDHQQALALEIPAGGFETATLQVEASASGTELLRQLQAGERNSLRYQLSGDVLSPEEGVLPFNREGHLYTVPGRPGQFR